jgi:hypothetical protein
MPNAQIAISRLDKLLQDHHIVNVAIQQASKGCVKDKSGGCYVPVSTAVSVLVVLGLEPGLPERGAMHGRDLRQSPVARAGMNSY